MGIFSSWNSASDFDLTAEDLATCEGYVTREAFRRLQAAKDAARKDAGSSLSGLARLVATRIIHAVAPGPAAAAKAAPEPALATTPGRSVASSSESTSSHDTPADAHVDRAA